MLSFTNRPAGSPVATGSPPAPVRTEDLREAPRRAAHEVPSITGLRISPPGVDATLVNISPSGLLAECSERLKAGRAVSVVFEGTFEPRSVEAREGRATEPDSPTEAATSELKDAPRGKAEPGRAASAQRGVVPGVNDPTTGAPGVSDRGSAAPAVSDRGGAPGVGDRGIGAPGLGEVARPVVRNRW